MKKIIRLTEHDIEKLVKRIIKEVECDPNDEIEVDIDDPQRDSDFPDEDYGIESNEYNLLDFPTEHFNEQRKKFSKR